MNGNVTSCSLPETSDPELYRPKTEFKDTLYNDIAIDI